MNAKENSNRRELSPAVIADAAAWVARLHSPMRTPAVEKGFRCWLKEHPDHGRAWELVTESWEEVAALRRWANIEVSLPSDSQEPAKKWLPLALAATLAMVAGAGALLYSHYSGSVGTGVGEQRMLVLEDGTRISLNTSTRMLVHYDKKRRRVNLESGEALFEVAKNSERPFVVSAGDRTVTALGTAFLVRRDPQWVAVTLMEGKVAVAPAASDGQTKTIPAAETVLVPGERATFVANQGSARVDHPRVETLTAWQRGKVPIENLSLAEAVAEMNRYNSMPIVIERREAEQLRVSGIFRAGDSLSFARAVSQSFGLEIQQQPGRILLAGSPRSEP